MSAGFQTIPRGRRWQGIAGLRPCMLLLAVLGITVVAWTDGCRGDAPTWSRYPDATTSYRVVGCTTADDPPVPRRACDIIVPLGRSQDQLLATAERAANELGAAEGVCGVWMRLARPGDAPGSGPAGDYVFAAGGEWESVPRRCTGPLTLDSTGFQAPKFATDLYFNPPPRLEKGQRVRAIGRIDASQVDVSRGPDDWGDDEIIGHVPTGSLGTVLSIDYGPVVAQEVGRIEVEFSLDGRKVRGWVHSFEMEPGPSSRPGGGS